MRLTMHIGEYDMDQVILDLGFYANVLPMNTWESLGKAKLQWSTIQLKKENQQKILPLEALSNVIVDIDEVRTTTDLKVIEIVDDTKPYPMLLGLDWVFSNMAIINLKKRKMIFERKNMRVIVPLDPLEGARYTKPVKE